MLAFELRMPGRGSWNGGWSQEDRRHIVVRPPPRKKGAIPVLAAGALYGYDFGDGWYASVTVTEVDSREARRLRRISAGFAGYEWMVDEILEHGRILTLDERRT